MKYSDIFDNINRAFIEKRVSSRTSDEVIELLQDDGFERSVAINWHKQFRKRWASSSVKFFRLQSATWLQQDFQELEGELKSCRNK